MTGIQSNYAVKIIYVLCLRRILSVACQEIPRFQSFKIF